MERVSVYWRPWNPVTGCSPRFGCYARCWARAVAERFPQVTDGCGFAPTFHPGRLAAPLHWQPERWRDVPLRLDGLPVVAVGYQGDLFDQAITRDQQSAVYGVMRAQPHAAFLTLTKSVAERRAFHASLPPDGPGEHCHLAAQAVHGGPEPWWLWAGPWPLPNVWEGTSISTQADVTARMGPDIDWLSVEPLLEHVGLRLGDHPRIRLVIVGPETGPRRRPCDPAWIASVVAQCAAADVRCLVKGKV
jgi:protein gp37